MDWQTVVSVCVVFAAMVFLVGKLFRSASGSSSGCGSSCSTCPASHSEQNLRKVSLVQIEEEVV